jgi:flagellar biogenesis protein FliO
MKKKSSLWIFPWMLCICLFTTTLLADEQSSNAISPEITSLKESKSIKAGSAVIKKSEFHSAAKGSCIFLACVGIIALIVKKKKITFPTKQTKNKKIELIEELSLGNGRSLLLLKVNEQEFLLSKEVSKLSMLSEIRSTTNEAQAESLHSRLTTSSSILPNSSFSNFPLEEKSFIESVNRAAQ